MMLKSAWFVLRTDIWHLVRSREAILWLFVMPVLFIYFIGTITGRFASGSASGPDELALRAPADAGSLADRLVSHLEANGYRVVRPPTERDFASRARRLTIPEGFTESVVAGRKVVVRLDLKDSGLGQDYDRVRVARSVYTLLADVVAAAEAGETPGPGYFQRLDGMPRALALEVKTAGDRQAIPTGFEQAVPGTMVQFSLLILLATGGTVLVIEHRQGLLRRLASTPLSREAIVLGKWGARLGLGLVQIGFAMAVGSLLFEMNWGPDLPMVVLILFGWGAFCASLGLFLGNAARSESQAIGIGILCGNLLAAFGGCWWPAEITPPWMQAFTLMLPTGWAMDALHKLISFRTGAASALPQLLAMLIAACAISWFTARRFRFE